jgi:toxin ParE1/3/4
MVQVIRSRASVGDYEAIWRYLAADSIEAADRIIEMLERQVMSLALMPAMGRPEPELAANLRSFPVGRFLIFYRPVKTGIELVRVLHSARDIGANFFA